MCGPSMVGSFDEVGIVAAASDHAWIGSVASGRVLLPGHVLQYPGDGVVTEIRGEKPPAS
jgi:hypothetical protein